MAHFFDLPEEILIHISTFFFFQDLISLSLTSRRLNKAVHARLRTHLELKKRYHNISDQRWNKEGPTLGWFDILAALLSQKFPPEYVHSLKFTGCPWYWNELSTLPHLTASPTEAPYNETDMNVVVKSALNSPWIYRDGSKPCGGTSNAADMSEFVAEVKQGDMDNILAILLPLLPNLERIELVPGEDEQFEHWFGSVPGVLSRIISGQVDPSRDHDLLRLQAPQPYNALQCLRYIRFDFRAIADQVPWANSLPELFPWICLPSLREVETFEMSDNRSYWRSEDNLPKSHVEKLTFYTRPQTLALQAVVLLAQNCLTGPCEITQRDRSGKLVYPGDTVWDWQAVRVTPNSEILTLGGIIP